MARAEQLLGWRAMHTDLASGVREMMEEGA
jgi:hypothetical protein